MSDPQKPETRRQQHKAETRLRILEASARLFRQHGIDGVGVDAIMQAAGLTHGGFYAHFASKEALAAEVCTHELAASARRWAAIANSTDADTALARIVGNYLRPDNVEAGDGGCVLPVLGSELARRRGSCAELTEIVQDMLDTLEHCLPSPKTGGKDRDRAIASLACMVGAVTLARLSANPDLAATMLRAARDAILRPGVPPLDTAGA